MGEAVLVVGLFDVLGFSERVRRRGIAEIRSEYDRLIAVVKKQNGVLCIRRVPAGDGHYAPAVGWLETDHVYFSDTILIWAHFEQFRYPAFCSLCASLVCEALSIGMPLRGTISVGTAVLDKKTGTFIGTALVEAAAVEKGQKWLGVSFAPSATKHIQDFDPRLVLSYTLHRKNGMEHLLEGPVLDWPRFWRENHTVDLTSTLRDLQQALGPHPYISAAMEFAAYSESQHDWFFNQPPMDEQANPE